MYSDDSPTGAQPDRFTVGMETRKQVLGTKHVQASWDNVTDFSRPIQEMVIEHCWADIWARPALDRRTRSLLNIAMLTAMNRPHELGVHIRGAIRNGCTVTDIQETLLQSAIYCGFPAALESFRLAESILIDNASLPAG